MNVTVAPITCYYCKEGEKATFTPVRFTIHDKRGCFHVCDEHAKWRMETSMIQGHSRHCPLREGR